MSQAFLLCIMVFTSSCQEDHLPQNIDDLLLNTKLKQAHSSSSLPINWNHTAQTIQGFGASSAWYGKYLTQEQINTLYNAKAANSIGLSLLRLHINPDGTTDELQPALWAQQLGAVVWASPWTPPALWKTNNSINNGGSLLPSHYSDYAYQQVQFLKNMESQGLHIRYLSAQNEPNYTAPWETCLWTAEQLATFIGSYLGPLLANSLPGVGIIAPETNGFEQFSGYTQVIRSNNAALHYTSIFATHDYYGAIVSNSDAAATGKPTWMTEVYVSDNTNSDDLNLGLTVASKIHTSLTAANINAWHYWWLLPDPQSQQQGLLQNNQLSLRAYAMGHFAKFVRPGFVRIALPQSVLQGNLLLSAYRSTTDKQFAIVGVNNNNYAVTQTVELTGFESNTLFTYLTNKRYRLDKSTPITARTKSQKNTFDLKIPSHSIMTWTNVNL